MKIYFLSSRPCALTLNGAYFGLTSTFEKFAEVSPKDGIFAEFIPEGASPIRFFITENLRFTPPEGCEVYLLKDGVAVFARDFPPNDFSLQPLLQKKFDSCLATLFKQGRIQLSLENSGELFVATLPPSFAPVDLKEENGYILVDGEKEIALYSPRAELLLHEKALSYTFENGELRAVLPLSDRLKRTAECVWTLSETGVARASFTLRQEGAENAERLREELLPYAFFESVLIGAEVTQMLSEELAEKADSLREFLGDFIGVTLTNDPRELGLVYKKAERLFELKYFRVTVENGKIADVQS
ncbi:MAG: hypothetical protein IJ506_01265 [Clostridia bacterium]|nr:hypothetical protein [Clostridia bacterium]